jgi:hypothetical protein
MTFRVTTYVLVVAALLSIFTPLAYAQGEGPADSLGQMISDLYRYSQTIVGFCVFLMFLYAGLLLMLGDRSKAQKIAQDAVIGLVLLFSAVVILNSINPDLTSRQGSSVPVIPQ